MSEKETLLFGHWIGKSVKVPVVGSLTLKTRVELFLLHVKCTSL